MLLDISAADRSSTRDNIVSYVFVSSFYLSRKLFSIQNMDEILLEVVPFNLSLDIGWVDFFEFVFVFFNALILDISLVIIGVIIIFRNTSLSIFALTDFLLHFLFHSCSFFLMLFFNLLLDLIQSFQLIIISREWLNLLLGFGFTLLNTSGLFLLSLLAGFIEVLFYWSSLLIDVLNIFLLLKFGMLSKSVHLVSDLVVNLSFLMSAKYIVYTLLSVFLLNSCEVVVSHKSTNVFKILWIFLSGLFDVNKIDMIKWVQ